MNTIFILSNHPRDLTIAVRTRDAGYYGAYDFFEAKYGWGDCDKITDSNQFKEIEIADLPDELKSDEAFRRLKDNIDKIFIHE